MVREQTPRPPRSTVIQTVDFGTSSIGREIIFLPRTDPIDAHFPDTESYHLCAFQLAFDWVPS